MKLKLSRTPSAVAPSSTFRLQDLNECVTNINELGVLEPSNFSKNPKVIPEDSHFVNESGNPQ